MKLIAIDPGETTGWSVWDTDTATKIDGGQHDLWKFIDALCIALLGTLPEELDEDLEAAMRGVERIVCEDWKIYPEKAHSGALDWDSCRTARGIGAIELIARMSRTPIKLYGANIKKAAQAMGAESTFVEPLHENRHENDSHYHAIYDMANNR